VDPNGPSAPRLRERDIILSVNGQRVSSAAEAGKELQSVASGRYAQILLWREGEELFVTIRKQ
jgi:S1-C subfamily serine protease